MRPSERMDWLTLPGWCHADEGDALYTAVRDHLKTGDQVVEIGTYYGRSAVALGLGAQQRGARVTSYDRDTTPERVSGAEKAIKRFGLEQTVTLRVEEANTATFDQSVALLYIDGWHDDANARANLTAWLGRLTAGGYLVLHDNCDAWPDVQRLVAELSETPGLTRLPDVVAQAWFQRGGAW